MNIEDTENLNSLQERRLFGDSPTYEFSFSSNLMF